MKRGRPPTSSARIISSLRGLHLDVELAAARAAMVQQQIEARGVRDPRVLEAMRAVPRHVFVPEALRGQAYGDHALGIGEGQTISQPYMVAVMTEALAPEAHHRVLEIGTGSGYQTAILARLSGLVFSMERHLRLADRAARRRFATLGVTNVEIHVGDGTEGLAGRGTVRSDSRHRRRARACRPHSRRSSPPGGRLVIPVGPPGYQHLTTIDRRGATRSNGSNGSDACSCR